MNEAQNDRIKELVDELFEIRKKMEKPQEELKALSSKLAPIEKQILDLMVLNQIKSFEDAMGRGKITWNAPIRGKVIDAREFFLSLRGAGDEAIAKVQIGPDLITDEIAEMIKNAKPEEVKIGMAWNSLLAYLKDKIRIKEEKRAQDEETIIRPINDYLLDSDFWPKGIEMNQNEPELKVKTPKK